MNWNELMCDKRRRMKTHKQSNVDLRTEFEKDYHRIISSASFRRLQDKTQVFPLDKINEAVEVSKSQKYIRVAIKY